MEAGPRVSWSSPTCGALSGGRGLGAAGAHRDGRCGELSRQRRDRVTALPLRKLTAAGRHHQHQCQHQHQPPRDGQHLRHHPRRCPRHQVRARPRGSLATSTPLVPCQYSRPGPPAALLSTPPPSPPSSLSDQRQLISFRTNLRGDASADS